MNRQVRQGRQGRQDRRRSKTTKQEATKARRSRRNRFSFTSFSLRIFLLRTFVPSYLRDSSSPALAFLALLASLLVCWRCTRVSQRHGKGPCSRPGARPAGASVRFASGSAVTDRRQAENDAPVLVAARTTAGADARVELGNKKGNTTMASVYLTAGVDVSKRHLDLAFADQNHRATRRFANDPAGRLALARACQGRDLACVAVRCTKRACPSRSSSPAWSATTPRPSASWPRPTRSTPSSSPTTPSTTGHALRRTKNTLKSRRSAIAHPGPRPRREPPGGLRLRTGRRATQGKHRPAQRTDRRVGTTHQGADPDRHQAGPSMPEAAAGQRRRRGLRWPSTCPSWATPTVSRSPRFGRKTRQTKALRRTGPRPHRPVHGHPLRRTL